MATLSSYAHVSTLAGTERVPVVVTPGVVGGNAYITADEQAASTPFTSRYVPIAGGVVLTDAAQTITTSTVTDITWGTEVSDPDGWTSGGSATLTVPTGKGGRYLVSCSGTWSAAPTSGILYGNLNGVGFQANTSDAVSFINTLTFLYTFVAGDLLKFRAYQTSGTNKDFVSRLEICPV